MKSNQKILVFILVNILVSALTTLAVLWLWEITHPRLPLSGVLTPSSIENQNTSQNPEQQTSDGENTSETALEFVTEDIAVAIRTVVGAGNLDMEYVEVFNQSQGPLDLSNWQLVNADDQRFTFPSMILNSGGAIKVYSKMGENTVIELYWQAVGPIWQSGENALLLDADGEILSIYAIP